MPQLRDIRTLLRSGVGFGVNPVLVLRTGQLKKIQEPGSVRDYKTYSMSYMTVLGMTDIDKLLYSTHIPSTILQDSP